MVGTISVTQTGDRFIALLTVLGSLSPLSAFSACGHFDVGSAAGHCSIGQVRSRDGAELMAQRILEAIGAPYRVEGHEIMVEASIGIALSPQPGKTAEALLSRSDLALYRVKERRGGYAFAIDPAPTGESHDRQRAA